MSFDPLTATRAQLEAQNWHLTEQMNLISEAIEASTDGVRRYQLQQAWDKLRQENTLVESLLQCSKVTSFPYETAYMAHLRELAPKAGVLDCDFDIFANVMVSLDRERRKLEARATRELRPAE